MKLEISGPDGKKIMLFDPASDPDDVNSLTVHVGGHSKEKNAETIMARVNAYPKLVDALRSTLGALEADAMRETDPQMRYYAERHHESVRALLRELGEESSK